MTEPAAARVVGAAGLARGPLLGVASQVLNAGTNVITAYLASLLLAPDEFGVFVIAFSVITIASAAGRGLVGTTMMVHLPAQDEADRAALVRSALGFTALAGIGVSLSVGLGGLLHPVLLAFAPWLTVALLHDVGRYVFLSAGATGRALVLDVIWALVQGIVLVAAWISDAVTLGIVALAWGLGALGGLVVFALLYRDRPAGPGPWARATRDVAGWFTAVAVVGQAEVYLVLVLTGLVLAPSDVGGLRAVQLLAFQPAVVLLAALLTVMQPTVVRARHSAADLRRAWSTVSLAVSPVIVGLALVALLREPLLGLLFGQYTAFSPLVLPVAIQSAFVALSVAPLAVLNGLRRGPAVLVVQLVRTGAIAGAAVVGAWLAGALGLAWALAIGSGLAWVQLSVSTRRSISRVDRAPSRGAEVGTH